MKIRNMIRCGVASLLLASSLCATASTTAKPKKGIKPMKEFVDDLLSRMTLEEKIGQINLQVAGRITTGSAQDTRVGGLIMQGKLGGVFNLKGAEKIRALQHLAVDSSRLHIPLMVGMDVIHGYETIFPIPLAMSCSWDMDAIRRAASVAAKEASADGICWVFSPMVDIAIDARWGRVAEGGGEDPFLGSAIAKAYIEGYQGDGNHYATDKVMACVKHFALYGAVEAGRDYNTVDMSHLRMYNQYFPPYRAAVEAGAGSFMSSFNIVDGMHATANPWLLTNVLRRQWGFQGFVTTDYDAILEMEHHGFGKLEHNAALAINAGTDMDMCSAAFLTTLASAVKKGLVKESTIDQACRRILEAKYKLGLFEDPYRYLDLNRRKTDIFTAENRRVARDIAAETFVLLKNDSNLLPLKKQGTIALIGPLADARNNMDGTWAVASTPARYGTVKEAMERALAGKATLLYAQGSNILRDANLQKGAEAKKKIVRGDNEQLKAEALAVARKADVIVCAMGECAEFSGESSSRATLDMPDVQRELLMELAKLGKPIVLLNFSGRPVVLTWEEEHLPAILQVWFGGSETGDAICDVLFGDKCPQGKLTTTFPRALGQVPIYYNHLNTGRPVKEGATKYQKFASNYIEVRNDPLYPFGYGLSYTTFNYSDVTLNGTKASVTVTNTGNRDADETVQLYIHDIYASVSRPVKELKGFRRIHLKAGEAQTVTFDITRDLLSYYDQNGNTVFEPGDFEVMIGPNSREVKKALLTINN